MVILANLVVAWLTLELPSRFTPIVIVIMCVCECPVIYVKNVLSKNG